MECLPLLNLIWDENDLPGLNFTFEERVLLDIETTLTKAVETTLYQVLEFNFNYHLDIWLSNYKDMMEVPFPVQCQTLPSVRCYASWPSQKTTPKAK